MSYIESILLLSHNYNIDFFKTLVHDCPVVSSTQVGENIEIELTHLHNEDLYPGMYLYIPILGNSGYHKILSVLDRVVTIAGTLILIPADTTVSIYSLNDNLLNHYINSAILYVEKITGLNLTEEKIITEFHDGNDSPELMLDRKNINSIESVKVISEDITSTIPSTSFYISNQGILIFKSSPDGTGFKFPKGENNIIVTYRSGYEYADTPDDIKLAISIMALYHILQDENAFTGGGGSISVVAYSQSFGPNGKYTEAKKSLSRNSKMLLSKYRSGVVGG